METPTIVINVLQNRSEISPKDHVVNIPVDFRSHQVAQSHRHNTRLQLKSRNSWPLNRGFTAFSHYEIAVNITLVVNDPQIGGSRVGHFAGITEQMEFDSPEGNPCHKVTS